MRMLILVLAVVSVNNAWSETTIYTRLGDQTFGSDGSISTTIGDQTFHSNGQIDTRLGNQVFVTDPVQTYHNDHSKKHDPVDFGFDD